MKENRSFSDDPLGTDQRASLARRPDFELCGITVRPSLRIVEGPEGGTKVEPLVMRVLLTLADAAGAVVAQDDLVERCWKGAVVGADSIHRAIGEARRAIRTAGARFAIETIPKTGFRMTLDGGAAPVEAMRCLERGRQALRDELPDANAQGIADLERATAIDPANAEAWGLLALAHRNAAENTARENVSDAIRASESAARRALALDANEGNALTALATLQPYFGEWLATEDALRRVLAVAPTNAAALGHLVTLLQSVGRTRESWDENERAIAIEPLSPVHQFRKALKSWIMGDSPQSDLVIDRAMQTWPRHPAVWNARLMLFAFSGRTPAALAMVNDPAGRPAQMARPAIDLWVASLRALATRAQADVGTAREANVAAASRSPGFALNAVMVLSALGELDAAFAVTDGFLLRRGPVTGSLWTGPGQLPVNDQRWRRTMFLYTPACAAMRADPRFDELCDRIGLMQYWEKRGVAPDYRLAARG